MKYWTRRQLCAQAQAIGLVAGDAVMVHAGLRSVGRILGGPDALIAAILDSIGVVDSGGTLLAYTDWDDGYHELVDDAGHVPADLRNDIQPFDPLASRARRANGAFAELVRTWPEALRSANPGASCAAIGSRAEWFTADHPLDYGYGEGSPLAKLVEARGKVLMLGAPLDTMTLLHHAEHLANIPGKRLQHFDMPLSIDGQIEWRRIEEFDTSDPVVEGLEANYFAEIVESFLRTGRGARDKIGDADCVLVPAADIVTFGVRWLADWAKRRDGKAG